MACFAVATTSATLKVALDIETGKRLALAFGKATGKTAVDLANVYAVPYSDGGWRVEAGTLEFVYNPATKQIRVVDWGLSARELTPEEQQILDKLIVKAQQAIVLQRLKAAGKLSNVQEKSGGFVAKIKIGA